MSTLLHRIYKITDCVYLLSLLGFLIAVTDGQECVSPGPHENCQNIGSLKGMIYALESIAVSAGHIVSTAKQNAENLEEAICIKKLTGNEVDEDQCIRAEPDCFTLQKMGYRTTGIYRIWPGFLNHSIKAYCDMETDGGGWTVIQRRGKFAEEHMSFYETWNNYKYGFGNLTEEFWLGNDFIFALTHQSRTTLRIELEDFDYQKRYATYSDFMMRSELENYKLLIGDYEGNAGDSLAYHNGSEFSTKDRGNDCAKSYKGGWWYNSCFTSNLNGVYYDRTRYGIPTKADGMNWNRIKGHHISMRSSEMKIRPCINGTMEQQY